MLLKFWTGFKYLLFPIFLQLDDYACCVGFLIQEDTWDLIVNGDQTSPVCALAVVWRCVCVDYREGGVCGAGHVLI